MPFCKIYGPCADVKLHWESLEYVKGKEWAEGSRTAARRGASAGDKV